MEVENDLKLNLVGSWKINNEYKNEENEEIKIVTVRGLPWQSSD